MRSKTSAATIAAICLGIAIAAAPGAVEPVWAQSAGTSYGGTSNGMTGTPGQAAPATNGTTIGGASPGIGVAAPAGQTGMSSAAGASTVPDAATLGAAGRR